MYFFNKVRSNGLKITLKSFVTDEFVKRPYNSANSTTDSKEFEVMTEAIREIMKGPEVVTNIVAKRGHRR